MNAVLYIRLARMFVLKFSHGNPILAVTSKLIRDFFFFSNIFLLRVIVAQRATHRWRLENRRRRRRHVQYSVSLGTLVCIRVRFFLSATTGQCPTHGTIIHVPATISVVEYENAARPPPPPLVLYLLSRTSIIILYSGIRRVQENSCTDNP